MDHYEQARIELRAEAAALRVMRERVMREANENLLADERARNERLAYWAETVDIFMGAQS